MAEAFEIAGPVDVSLDPAGAVTVAALGRSDGEERISFDIRVFGREIFADETGLVPADIIHLGMTGLLTMQLVKYDRVVLNSLWNTIPRTALSGDIHLNTGVVGQLWSMPTAVSGVGYFQILLTPDLTDTRIVYTFGKCYLMGDDAIREAEIGNDTTVLRLSINVLPDGNGDLYIQSTT